MINLTVKFALATFVASSVIPAMAGFGILPLTVALVASSAAFLPAIKQSAIV